MDTSLVSTRDLLLALADALEGAGLDAHEGCTAGERAQDCPEHARAFALVAEARRRAATRAA